MSISVYQVNLDIAHSMLDNNFIIFTNTT